MADRVQMFREQVEHVAAITTLPEVKPHAAECRAGRCDNYGHCLTGIPMSGKDGLNYAVPVCAATVERHLMAIRPEPGRIVAIDAHDGGFQCLIPHVTWHPGGHIELNDSHFTLGELMWIVDEIKRRQRS